MLLQKNTHFNIEYHKPKKDLCDKCYIFQRNLTPTPQETAVFETHKIEKLACKADRDIDRSNIDPDHCIVCYDLQKVFGLPKGNASIFYYKLKLNVFNLNATQIMADGTKITYCAIWTEAHSGRSGNDITSALIKILSLITREFNHIKIITLWSDSCVPQNRNRINSTDLKNFLHKQSNLIQILQKFSEPGHSNIQEIDCVHSTIDRYLKNVEIHSPLHFIKLLTNMNSGRVTLRILQMVPNDFITYTIPAAKMDFSGVPFSKIKIISNEKDDPGTFRLKYKKSFREIEFKSVSLSKRATKKVLGTPKNLYFCKLFNLQSNPLLNEKKRSYQSFSISSHRRCYEF